MNSDSKFIIDNQYIRPEKSEVLQLWGDKTLLKKLTNYIPEDTLKEGLELACKRFSQPGIINIKNKYI